MAQSVILYNLLVSCPGDIKDELSLIESAVEEFNEFYAEPLGITIKTRHWKKSSYAQSGGKPQTLLNEQVVNKCDAAVAIFWTRFGSPTDEYDSGTEEEIEVMLQSGKQVFMYFSDKPISPSQVQDEQYKKIQNFRDKYKDRGLYFTYSSNEEFRKLFFAHLSMHFLSDKKNKDTTFNNVSELKLIGIDKNDKLSEEASVYPFSLNTETNMPQFLDVIRSMYQEISEMHVGKRVATNSLLVSSFMNPVDIEAQVREYITTAAEQLNIELVSDFFDLGNLSRNPISSSLYGDSNLKGMPLEIDKYRKIQKLRETISEALEWAPIEKAFSNKQCLRLAIQNYGKAIDEDVEIVFELPQNALLTLKEFPHFNNDEMGYLLNDCDMSVLFGIDSTAEYAEYFESLREPVTNHISRAYGLPGYTPNYNDDFIKELDNIFCYSIYSSGDQYIVKLKIDYIKHHTTIAFPSVLFVKSKINEIPYKITSKNKPDVVEGILKVQNGEN